MTDFFYFKLWRTSCLVDQAKIAIFKEVNKMNISVKIFFEIWPAVW